MMKKLISGFAALGVALVLTPQAAFAQQFETYGVRKAADILPPALQKGQHFRVRDDVVSYDYLHHFTVESDFGTFEVTGDAALRKLVPPSPFQKALARHSLLARLPRLVGSGL